MEIQEIKAFMKQNKITYDDLAQKSGVSISTIKKIFSGISSFPRIDTMKAIENALGLDKQNPPSILTEGEQDWLELYYLLNETNREMLVKMVTTFRDLPSDRRRFVLDAIQFALGQK